jgi:hypothetical protein
VWPSASTSEATPIGNLWSARTATVDAHGLVTPWPAGWSLDWWIGADDRWHVPSREAAVRQTLVDDVPVVETAMRVPGGDAVHRAYAVRPHGGAPDELAVVEIENASRLPFVVALAIRPYHGDGVSRVRRISLDRATAAVDGRPALLLPRPPALIAESTGAAGDCAAAVFGGAARADFGSGPQCRDGRAQAAFLFPLAHAATLRAAMPLWPGRDAPVPAGALPSAGQVARGWVAQLRRGMRADFPDQRLAAAVSANRAFLLLGGERGPAAERLAALEAFGFHDEAASLRASVKRRSRGSSAKAPDADELVRLLAAASPTWAWPDVTPAAFLLAVRSLLVAEPAVGAVALCPAWPAGWIGRPLEVHAAPTAAGLVSYAVRWHGERPALLWELELLDAAAPVRISVPGLDPAWSSTERRGEALLARTTLGAGDSFT